MNEHEQRHAAYLEQVRAKYNADQLKALQAKGHTFPGGVSYPIDDAEDLDNAIHAVGRGGADHDAIRKYIIGRAKAMGESDKIPENWKADGSLGEDKAANMTAEERASYKEKHRALSSAISNQPDQGSLSAWLADFDDEKATYESGDRLFQVPYKEKGDGSIKLGVAQEVQPKVSYEPVESKSARAEDGEETCPTCKGKGKIKEGTTTCPTCKGSGEVPVQSNSRPPATPKRAGFSSFVEWSPPQTVDVNIRMDDGETGLNAAHFVGYPSTTGVPYSVRDWLGEYEETINPGAFSKTLREQEDVPMLFNHDGVPMASTASATSRLAEDGKGLRNEAEFDRRDALTNSVCVQLSRGVLGKMSFSFRGVKDTWNDLFDKRGVDEAQLFDTSIVTYPANPTAEGELVDAMRSALGREGRSLWLAENELSVRSALPVFVERQELPEDGEDLLERALRALAHADEVVCRSKGPQGRARTFLVAHAMIEMRAGKTLSSKNEGLLKQALDSLGAADKQHQKIANSHAEATDKVASVLAGASSGSSPDGQSDQVPPGTGENPISPKDGAGPRAANPYAVARAREREREQLRSRR